ncbi:putative oxidoreductase Rv1144 [Microbacterium oxydans]|uniref:Diacetyl reductase [(S)-acetoin forming] n=1 Tax=Microbacterium oxydans TaxID=82380 RepID=A0A0F0LCP5_9MICO|nr:SDR family NAD(P)-dependent oxidoreductase [Microbacterium oxydans]KJL30045.1 Diacetyl reductase [(S)-acetoin forming] [Microbacterium oxydans]CAH0172702.1 putative oxidoreductase Rv1144 [Microbacterium oxydans]
MQLNGSSAIVTGGASGLGAATARALAAHGAEVFALDLPAAITSAPTVDGVTLVAADVTDAAQVRDAVRTASAGAPLRVAVNCAGIAPSARLVGRAGAHDPALFEKVVGVNLVGTFLVMSVAAEAIAAQTPDAHGQRGVIVNTASIAAYDGQIGQVAYAASKGAVVGMTLPAARDLATHGIRVCTIAPGIVDTPMLATVSDEYRANLAASVPFPHRLCDPTEYAQLVTMIIQHDYLNGETIRMDGALRMGAR